MKVRRTLRVLGFLVAGAAPGYLIGGGALPPQPASSAQACSYLENSVIYSFTEGTGDPEEVERWRRTNEQMDPLSLSSDGFRVQTDEASSESFHLSEEPVE